ncbi:MAG: GGDEF domain-containing protein [Dehalococcoidia bacterium]|nr:MAG: GGDEF domain-containing protein [Dehalococcoidia bacterium]
MRALKRWVRLGAYGAICAEWPLYYLVLDYPIRQVVSSWVFGMVVATVAIEFAFAQGYRLRKQGIYPAMLAVELGATHDFDQACERTVRLAAKLLAVEKVVLALSVHHDGQLTTMATHGIPTEEVPLATPLPWCQQLVKQAIEKRKVVVTSAAEARAWLSTPDGRGRVVYVPLLSLDRFVGLLVLVGGRKASDLRDKSLLTTIGLAVGLTLDNLRHSTELHEVATHDELTQLFSRRYLFQRLEKELKAARRSGRPLGLLIMDVDSLKLINDTYGHNVGDAVLANLGKMLAKRVRGDDIPARIGGDEFAVLMPNTDKRRAFATATRLEKALQTKPIYKLHGLELKLSVSCGVAGYPWSGEDIVEIVQWADANMYGMKATRKEHTQPATTATQERHFRSPKASR